MMTARPSGMVQDAQTGDCVIPASVRADGSIRKERRVRPGFLPLEDVPRFRSRRLLERKEAERHEEQARFERSKGAKSVPQDATKGSYKESTEKTPAHTSSQSALPTEPRSRGARRMDVMSETRSKGARRDAPEDSSRDHRKAAPRKAKHDTPSRDAQDAKEPVKQTNDAPRTAETSSVDALEERFSSLSMQGISGR